MNVYDFDDTIYHGDSSVDFMLFCLKRHPRLVFYLPFFIFVAVLHKMGRVDKETLKGSFFSFLRLIQHPETEVALFWGQNTCNIASWYLSQKRDDDLVISASPHFLLSPVAERFRFRLIASDVDIRTGTFLGKNCKGAEKVNRFRAMFGHQATIQNFYSDSLSDTPLADIAEKAYWVRKNEIISWPST